MSWISEVGSFSLTGNAGGAVSPVADNISILGSGAIVVTGNPLTGTLTISGGGVPAITNHALAVGTGVTISSLALGTTGTVLTGVTGADPAFSANPTLTSVLATTFDTNVVAAGVTLSGTTLSADGTDAAISINITAKGTGKVIINDLQLSTDLAVSEGGTGVSTLTDHGVLVGSGTAAIDALAVGSTGTILTGVSGADPTWTTATYPSTVTKGDVLVASANNVVGVVNDVVNAGYVLTANAAAAPTFQALPTPVVGSFASDAETIAGTVTNKATAPSNIKAKLGTQTLHGLPIGTSDSVAIAWTAEPSDGQILIGKTGNQPVLATISSGNNITATAGAGTISIAVTGTTQHAVQVGGAAGQLASLAVGTTGKYLRAATGADPGWSTLTLPDTVTKGDVLVASADNVVDVAAGAATAGWVLTANGALTAPTFQAPSAGVTYASDAETIAGTVTNKAVAPSNLKAKLGLQTLHALPIGTSDSVAIGWLAVGTTGQTLMGSTGADCGWTGSPSFSGSVTAGTTLTASSGAITATSGNVVITSGNLTLPMSTSSVGQIIWNSIPYLHNYGTTGDTGNFFAGYNAGNFTLTTASALRNIGIGTTALSALTTGTDCTAIGYKAGATGNTTTSYCTYIGSGAGVNSVAAGAVIIGYNAVTTYATAAAAHIVSIGYNAGKNLSGTATVTAVGYNVLGGTTAQATDSVVIGEAACSGMTGGADIRHCTMVGKNVGLALGSNGSYGSGSVDYNDIFGYNAAAAMDMHQNNFKYNCIFGSQAIHSLTSPEFTYNCFFGYNSGGSMNSNQYTSTANTFIGAQTGATVTSVNGLSYNTFIGYGAGNGYTAGSIPASCICIGYNAGGTSSESNILRIGNATGTSTGNIKSAYICGIYTTAATPSGTAKVTLVDSANVVYGLAGTAGQILQGGTAPAFSTATYPSTTAQGDLLLSTSANTIQALAKDTNATRYLSNTGTSNNAAWAQVDLSNGVTGTLSSSNGGAMTWTEITSDLNPMVVSNGYICNKASLLTVTLPATAAVGQRVAITGKGTGLWQLAQNSGQTIHYGSIDSTTGAGGYLAATVRYDCVEVQCITANTDWVVIRSVGTITVV